MDKFTPGSPLPDSVGACADMYSDVRARRLAMDKEVAEVKRREAEIREHIINSLSKSDDTGAAGQRYRAQIVTKSRPKVEDWAALQAFVQAEGRFDLLQKRTSDKAIMDMLAEGEHVPGVAKMHVPEVSITKI